MKEIRLHGRGGQGVVKASHIIVKAAVKGNKHGQFIPFFGVERKGSPVYGYLRVSDVEIRRKTQVYNPDVLLIFDDSLLEMPATFSGLKDAGTVIINTAQPLENLHIPKHAGTVATIDATQIALNLLGKGIPNTAMVGAFARVTGLVDKDILFAEVEETFGSKNRAAATCAYEQVAFQNNKEAN